MTVTSVETSIPNLTITWTADFESPVADVWALWADPRLLERWMGPPTYPAKVEAHKLAPDGEVVYVMTGPAGEKFPGRWKIVSVDPPTSLTYVDANEQSDSGTPLTKWSMRLADRAGGSYMELLCSFATPNEMGRLISMGTEEGHTLTIGQMDDLLTRLPEHAATTSGEGNFQ